MLEIRFHRMAWFVAKDRKVLTWTPTWRHALKWCIDNRLHHGETCAYETAEECLDHNNSNGCCEHFGHYYDDESHCLICGKEKR